MKVPTRAELLSALRNLRDACTESYKRGNVDALAFITAGNLLDAAAEEAEPMEALRKSLEDATAQFDPETWIPTVGCDCPKCSAAWAARIARRAALKQRLENAAKLGGAS